MNKHNKKRNTGFIYEALVREIIKQTIKEGENKRDYVVSLVKKHFNKNSLLYKDLIYYKTLSETKDVDEKFATKLLNETVSMREKINKKELFKEQSHIISQINKNVSKTVFSNFVPSYKFLASIGQLFNDELKPKTKVLLETQIIDNMVTQEHKKQGREIRLDNTVINTFVKRFNDSYNEQLLSEQKTLINHYIKSFTDNGLEFKVFLDREINRLLSEIKKNSEDKDILSDSGMKEKYDKVQMFLENINNRPVDEEMILKITQVQQLIKEINSND